MGKKNSDTTLHKVALVREYLTSVIALGVRRGISPNGPFSIDDPLLRHVESLEHHIVRLIEDEK